MITFKKLKIKNFLSFGNKVTEVDLSEQVSTLITGNNLDIGDTGESGNGSGKTSTFQALTFALYGKGFDKLKTDDFINLVNEKNLVVELELSVNGTDYKIIRQRKPNSVELYSGTTNLTLDSMANTDKAIVELIYNIPHHVFLGIFALTPHLDPFMAMSTPDQRNFIESILSLDVLAKRAEKLKVIRKEQQVDIKIAEEKLATVKQNNEKTEAQIQKISMDAIAWEDQQQTKLDTIDEHINQFVSYDEKEIVASIDALEKLTQEINDLKSKGDEQSREILQLGDTKEMVRTISDIQEEMRMLDEVNARYEAQFAVKQETLNSLLTEYGTLEKLNELNNSKKDALKKAEELRYKSVALIGDLKQQNRSLVDLRNKLDALVQETDTLASGECPYCKQSHFDQDKVERNIQTIEGLENKISEIEEKINQTHKEIADVELESNSIVVDDTDYDSIINKIHKIEYQISHDRKTHEENFSNYERRLSSLCGDEEPEQVILNLTLSIAEKESVIEKKKTFLSETQEKLKSRRVELNNIESSIKFKTIEQYRIHMMKYEKLIEDKRRALEQENPYMAKIETLESTIVDETELKEVYEEAVKLEKHTGYLIKLLTDPKSFIRKNILDQYIPVLNKKILENATELGLGHICTINSDLSVDVSYMSRPVSYYNLSQGERLRLNLAVSSAFRYLMSMLGKSTNLIMVDEYLDSALDASGMRKAFNFIKKQSKSVWIISHKDELKGQIDRVMTVTKQNGFSSISFKQG